jgi:hypothetical protein
VGRTDRLDRARTRSEPPTDQASSSPLRDFWIASDQRGGRPVTIAAEVTTADETYEIVASGAAALLMAEGNAIIYARPVITWVPVDDLSPAHLAIAWRRDDARVAVKAFVQACLDTIAASPGSA